jgi:hypothetical protein
MHSTGLYSLTGMEFFSRVIPHATFGFHYFAKQHAPQTALYQPLVTYKTQRAITCYKAGAPSGQTRLFWP